MNYPTTEHREQASPRSRSPPQRTLSVPGAAPAIPGAQERKQTPPAKQRSHAARHVAHEAVPGIQRVSAVQRGTQDAQAYARETYSDQWSATVGDETVTLRYYGPAHTAGDSVVHFENANVVHMGDLVFNRLPPYIDLAAGASTPGWISVMEAAHAEFDDDTLFLYGHGQDPFGVTGSRADLLVQRDLLTALNDHVAAGLAAGQSPDEIAVDVLPAFPDHATEQRTIARSIRAVIEEQQR